MRGKMTEQMKEWVGKFGEEYTDRNYMTEEEEDKAYIERIGITKTKLNEIFLSGLTINNALEVGCNIGIQLLILNKGGYKNLYGVEINEYAINISKEITKGKDIYIIKGSALDIPYKDSFFDLVFTSGVLIHISPDDINLVLDEIYRCTKRYILGYEYYFDKYTIIDYREENNLLWKADFARLFMERHKDLKLVKEEKYPYLDNPENIDTMYLLEKSGKGD
jgi:pseudaminic acid biosynthesis-associated methylase